MNSVKELEGPIGGTARKISGFRESSGHSEASNRSPAYQELLRVARAGQIKPIASMTAAQAAQVPVRRAVCLYDPCSGDLPRNFIPIGSPDLL